MDKKQQQPQRLVICLKDIRLIHDCSRSTASRKMIEAKDHFQKKPDHDLTIQEYCEWSGIKLIDTLHFLNLL